MRRPLPCKSTSFHDRKGCCVSLTVRAVRGIVAVAAKSPSTSFLLLDDLLGPKDIDVSSSQPLQQLGRLTGLNSVEQNLLGLIRTNAELEEQERPLKDVCLNRVFLGNPGTGKTTVAGIYGAVLRDLGLLSKGDVLVKVPADFIGDVLGASEKRTMAILEEARGRVLVIDEAYGLHSGKGMRDPFKEAVIDTIVAKVQGVPGDDRCVLLVGYKEQMETMMREANPGLARRFQLSQAWNFEDYSDDQLLTIIRERANKSYGWQLDWPCLQAALSTLDKERRRPNFGNAGAVNNLLSAAAMRMEDRNKHLSPAERSEALPAAEDFMTEADAAVAAAGGAKAAAGVFTDLIGCKSVLGKLKEWQATIRASQRMGKDPLESFELNFLFTGSPGTGKTTIARRVGKLFQQLGILATDEVVECSAGDFVTGYVNQSASKTRDMFKQALGGVLFIDEAYRLNPQYGGQFMSEVLDEICQILTDKQFMGKMVVVLAGYEAQIEELLSVNPGLKSRFSERLAFPDFTADDAVQLLKQQLGSQYGLEMSAEAEDRLPGLMQQLIDAPGWSNGRDVMTWVKRIFRAYSLRLQEEEDVAAAADEGVLTVSDLQSSLQDFLASKAPPKASTSTQPLPSTGLSPWDGIQLAPQFAQARPPPATALRTDTATAPPAVTVTDSGVAEMDTAEDTSAQRDTAPAGPGSFGNLPTEFLQDVQTALEDLGYDLSSEDAMQTLAGDPSLVEQLLPVLTASGAAPAVVTERLRQWQQAIQEQLELEKKMKAKKQRPIWRCAVCGRYGCPVAPYIESYEEVE